MFCVGGLGAGKSHGGQIWDLARALENGTPIYDPKPTISWTVAPNYRITRTLFILTLQVAVDVFGMREGTHFKIKRSAPFEISLAPNGQNHIMQFLSAANPEHFVSDSITHWRWSECGVSKEDVYEKLEDRLRDKRAKVLQGLGDGTPEGIHNRFYELAGFVGGDSDKVKVAGKQTFRAFRVETRDNVKNLAPGYLEALEARYAYDPNKLKSYSLGLFTPFADKSSAYWEFYESRNVVGEAEVRPDPLLPVILTWDWNKTPLAWVAMQKQVVSTNYFERHHRYVALKECTGEVRGVAGACAEFSVHFPVAQWRDVPIEVYGDRSGFSGSHLVSGDSWDQVKEALMDLGYRNVRIVAENKTQGLEASLEQVAKLMAYGLFVVSSECERLIESFLKTSLKDGTWDIDKPAKDTYTHWADAARYALYQITRHENVLDPNFRPTYGFNL